ncbi:response regulator transcription factor [Aureibaculum algae]|uniref:Phosphate regulon transcriptional regulatory protein PhoB n=1 Tax=Aureibaculum algae TaxID=2584122 RepID=A0A5B7TLG5_9FLAO|nr:MULTISPECIES: response regulator transcription factor [Aureibaculum]QCX36998.1 response regulator transcription factor [Aureibaculum algae]
MKKKNIKVLLVDDEPDVLEIVGYNLKNEGYQIFTATNGLEAIEKAREIIPHLILLDVMMPKMDGVEACQKIRKIDKLQDVIVAFFTARGEDYSQLAGFDAGADDYITKPVKPKVLVSKVNSLLRRVRHNEEGVNTIMTIGDIIINREEYFVQKDNTKIILPRKEFELMALLASKPNKVFERDVILKNVWGNDVIVGGRTIDVHIRRLREKVGEKYFKTVKGVGYKFSTN